jgi:hypothetical protein
MARLPLLSAARAANPCTRELSCIREKEASTRLRAHGNRYGGGACGGGVHARDGRVPLHIETHGVQQRTFRSFEIMIQLQRRRTLR